MAHDGSGTELGEAAAKGDLETVTILINGGVDVNIRMVGGVTALMKASMNGHLEVIKFLIEKGAYVNQTDKFGYNALLWAVDKQVADLNTIKYLVEHQCNINAKTKETRYTPLHWLAFHGDLEKVKYLLQHGAKIDGTTNKGETPVYLAAAGGHIDVLEYFIDERKADFDFFRAVERDYVKTVQSYIERKILSATATDSSGLSLLHRAARAGAIETVKYLVGVEKVPVNANEVRRVAGPLHEAAGRGHAKVVTYLVEEGANVGAKDRDGRTPLYWAADNGFLEVVKFFADEKGANVFQVDNDGNTLLHAAEWKGSLGVVKYLVEEKKLNVNAIDKQGNTPLLEVAGRGYLEVVIYLVGQGANMNAKDHNGRTPLYWAADNGFFEVVKFFGDQKGVNFFQVDNEGNTLLHAAEWNGSLDVVKYLVEEKKLNINAKDKQSHTPLLEAAGRGHFKIVTYLVEKGANIDAKDRDGRTPLYWAADNGFLEVVKFFVDKKGANVFQVDNDSNTLLHAAEWKGSLDVVKYLVGEKKLNVNAIDKQGNTPLLETVSNGKLDVFHYLLEEGKADVRLSDSLGKTCLHEAAEKGFIDIVKLLVNRGADVNAKDKSGRSPLFYAVNESGGGDRLSVVKYFVEEKKANVQQTDDDGNTLLHAAALRGRLNVVKYMVEEHSADVDTKNNNGRSPLAEALESDKVGVVEYLRSRHAHEHRRRRSVTTSGQPMAVASVNAAYRRYSAINYLANYARTIASDSMASSYESFLRAGNPVWSNANWDLLGGVLMLLNVGRRKLFWGATKNSYTESRRLFSPPELLEHRIDPNATRAIEESSRYEF